MTGRHWRPVGVFSEGEPVVLDGVNIWDAVWVPVEVRHPNHSSQMHTVYCYELAGGSGVVRFAAGELSAGAWGVFVPAAS